MPSAAIRLAASISSVAVSAGPSGTTVGSSPNSGSRWSSAYSTSVTNVGHRVAVQLVTVTLLMRVCSLQSCETMTVATFRRVACGWASDHCSSACCISKPPSPSVSSSDHDEPLCHSHPSLWWSTT